MQKNQSEADAIREDLMQCMYASNMLKDNLRKAKGLSLGIILDAMDELGDKISALESRIVKSILPKEKKAYEAIYNQCFIEKYPASKEDIKALKAAGLIK